MPRARGLVDGDDGDDAEFQEISTDDGRDDAGLNAEVAGQLAGATSQIAEQLSVITEEMNKLRSELYSDNGLGSIRAELDALRSGGLEQIQQQVEQIEAATTGATPGSRSRPAASSRGAAPADHADRADRADHADHADRFDRDAMGVDRGRRVSFDAGTRDVARRHGDGKAAMVPRSRRQQELRGGVAVGGGGGGGGAAGGGLSWVPYLVVFALVCVGPARPLIRPMLASLWPATDEPTPWYDAPYED